MSDPQHLLQETPKPRTQLLWLSLELGEMDQSPGFKPSPAPSGESSDPELEADFWENVANLAVVQIRLSDPQPPTAAQRMNGAGIQHQCWILGFPLFFFFNNFLISKGICSGGGTRMQLSETFCVFLHSFFPSFPSLQSSLYQDCRPPDRRDWIRKINKKSKAWPPFVLLRVKPCTVVYLLTT